MRFESYGRLDTPDTGEVDRGFTGINMTVDKPILPAGTLSLGQNTRLRTGRIKQRAGTTIPNDFNPGAGFTNFLVGSGVFRNPNSNEVLLVAPAGATYTYALQDTKDPVTINYGTGTGNNGLVAAQFVQSFEKVQLLRRGGPTNLVWNGLNAGTWDIPVLSPEGLTLVPSRPNGEPFMDRIIYYNAFWAVVPGRDTWLISDIEDYTSYDDIYQVFRTNPGESDYITRIMSYFRGSVVIFKNQSIHQATLLPTFPVTITQRILNRSMGSIGLNMPLMVGGDILFLSQPNGFYSLQEVIQEQTITLPVPISEPIQPVIDNINWGYTAIWGSSVALGNYAFFGVAMGVGTTQLNTVLVYDTQRKQWESAGDTWRDPAFGFNALHVTNYRGVQRVFAVDYLNEVVYLLYEGISDDLKSGTFSVPFKMETRGYVGDDPIGFKRFGRAQIGIATYSPSVTVTALNDGFNEEKLLTLTPITKSRLDFYPHGHKAFDVLTDDPTEAKRKDYSIQGVDEFAIEDFEGYPAGPISVIYGTAPLTVAGDLQESVERFLVRSFGRWCALRIENDDGVCEVTSTGVESTHAMTNARTAA